MTPKIKFELLRDGANEGGSGGGSPQGEASAGNTDAISSLEARNRDLEAKLGRMQAKMDQMETTNTRNAQQSQIAQLKAQVDMNVTEAENAVNTAETALAAALEDGDPAAIAKAQREISVAASTAERRRAERDQFNRELQQAERREGGARTESATANNNLDTTNLNDWKNRNKEWYGVDSEMTRVSHEIDSGIRAAGTYTVGSKEYFDAIDRAMKQRFPDRYSGAPASASARGDSDPGRGTPRRYDREIQRSMDAFGLSPESWDAARKKAVEKGFLPDTPSRGRVLQ